ncbi:MAG: hypothetical protein HXX20_04160 [Chloroflexi bacterium]|nr:hypothetical protein [Chloroflexota bacterium]
MLTLQEISRELEAGRHYCACCHPPTLLIRRAGSPELLASCLNTGRLYRTESSGRFVLVEGETGLEGGRRPSLAPTTVIDLSRESYS